MSLATATGLIWAATAAAWAGAIVVVSMSRRRDYALLGTYLGLFAASAAIAAFYLSKGAP